MSAKHKKDMPYWKKKLYQRLQIISWCKNYDGDSAISDLIAGVTVGLTVMPQSLAYATLAGLEPQVFYLITRSFPCTREKLFNIEVLLRYFVFPSDLAYPAVRFFFLMYFPFVR